MATTSPNTRAKEAEEQTDLWDTLLSFWRALRKNWILAAAVTLTAVVATAFFTLGQKKIYRSAGTIQIDPTPPRPLGNEIQSVVEMGTGAYLNNREYYETQYRILKSGRVANAVVRQLGLHRDAAFLRNSPQSETPAPMEVPVEAAADILLTRLEIEPEKQSRLVTVAVQDANPERAQRLVAAVIETYREQNLDNVLASTTSAVDWLEGQLKKLKKELEADEFALHDYKKQKNILSLSLDDQSNMLRGEMGKLNELLTEVRAKRENIDSRRQELRKINLSDPTNLPASELLESQLLQALRTAYVESIRDRDSLLASGKGKEHPSVAAANAKVEINRKALAGEVKNILGSVEKEYRAVTRESGGLKRLYDSANKRALELNLMEIEYNRLKRAKENTERLYSVIQDRTKESDLTRMMRVNNIHVVDEARVPKAPIKPSVPLNLAMGLIVGLVLGVGASLGKEVLDRSIKSPDDLEKDLHVAFLGLLPALSGETAQGPGQKKRRRRRGSRTAPVALTGRPELVVHDQPTSGIAEAARSLRTNLLFMSPDKPYKTLLVTSAAPMEGKTTVASCIAVAMAQAGQKVVIVDCDMRRPRLHKIFDKTNDVGLTSALLDIDAIDDGLKETVVPNLSVLSCGPIPPNPAELLHSEAFSRVLHELQERFDRVVIDSPPLVPVTDATILSTRVDGTVFVVRAGKTSKEFGKRAVRSIRGVGGNLVGAVLNAVHADRPGYNYYYQYYYYRQGYAPTGEADAPRHEAGLN
ncbi:MAG: polysaccharide biosynthesis tyrosine autokinase [Polyangiaceae bacterium]